MNGQVVAFIVLVCNQLAGSVAFVAVYRRSDWRASAIGRHLMFYAVAAGGIDASWLLLVTVKRTWLMYVLFASQLAFGLLTWQRVLLAVKAHRAASQVGGTQDDAQP